MGETVLLLRVPTAGERREAGKGGGGPGRAPPNTKASPDPPHASAEPCVHLLGRTRPPAHRWPPGRRRRGWGTVLPGARHGRARGTDARRALASLAGPVGGGGERVAPGLLSEPPRPSNPSALGRMRSTNCWSRNLSPGHFLTVPRGERAERPRASAVPPLEARAQRLCPLPRPLSPGGPQARGLEPVTDAKPISPRRLPPLAPRDWVGVKSMIGSNIRSSTSAHGTGRGGSGRFRIVSRPWEIGYSGTVPLPLLTLHTTSV